MSASSSSSIIAVVNFCLILSFAKWFRDFIGLLFRGQCTVPAGITYEEVLSDALLLE